MKSLHNGSVTGQIVAFRPDLNAERMESSCKRLEMPVFPKERFVDAVVQTVAANEAYVPPYGSGATLYIRPYMFGSDAVIGVKPANEYQFRIFTTPVGPYFKGGAKPITIPCLRLRPRSSTWHRPYQSRPELRNEPLCNHGRTPSGLR